jgi:hypothetical protein
MYQGISIPEMQISGYYPYLIGHLTVEHTFGNKEAYLTFDYRNEKYNYWQWIKEQTGFIGPLKPGRQFTLIDYTGKLAIQYVLDQSEKVNVWDLVDLIFKNEFYNRSYCDYFKYYLSEVAA